MYRFLLAPRWLLFHVLVVAAIVAMINLGFWQLRRLDERQAFNDMIETRYDRDPVSLDELLVEASDGGEGDRGADLESVEWRPVSVRGQFLPDEELRVVNRSQTGLAGDNVVTPLRLDDGRIVLVARGFVPQGAPDDQVAEAPPGDVALVGRAHPSEERRRGQLTDPGEGELTEVQRIDLDRLAAQLPGEVAPLYLDQATDDSEDTNLPYPQPIAEPELTEGPHLGYAVQWFVFSLCAAVGWVLAVRRSAATRRQESVVAAET